MFNRFLCASLPQNQTFLFWCLPKFSFALFFALLLNPPLTFTQGGSSGGGGGSSTPIEVCGDNIDRRYAPGTGEGDPVYSDRFGNAYTASQLYVPQVTNCGCSEFLGDPDIPNLANSYFNLTFQDLAQGTNAGFAHSSNGPAYRKVACKVFADIAALIQPRQAACDLENPLQVQVEIAPGNTTPATDWLAVGSPIYKNVEYGGIIDGMPYRLINSSVEPDLFSAQMFHGMVRVSFLLADGNTYYTGLDGNPGSQEYDLYTVLYHEALHVLGFGSLMQPSTGIPGLPGGVSYSRFATFLRQTDETPVIVENLSDPFAWDLNIPTNELHINCSGNPGSAPHMKWGGTQIPIYTGPSISTNRSAFSHLGESCIPNTSYNYVMQPSLPLDVARPITIEEMQILCDLGYNVLGLTGCDCNGVAVNDLGPACTDDFFFMEYCPDNPTSLGPITPAQILGNDYEVTDIYALEPASANDGTIQYDAQTDTYTFTPSRFGSHIIKYIAEDANCLGDAGYLYIQVLPCSEGCEFSDPANGEVNGGYNNNECNLICNPEFYASTNTTNESAIVCNDSPMTPGFELPGWFPAVVTPDFLRSTYNLYHNNSSSGAGGMRYSNPSVTNAAQVQESIYTNLPGINSSSGRYLISMYTRADAFDINISPGVITSTVHAELVNDQVLAQFGSCNNLYLTNDDLNIPTGSIFEVVQGDMQNSTISAGSWSRWINCFSLEENNGFKALWVYHEVEDFDDEPARGLSLILDQVELIPDDFTAGNDAQILCGQSYDLGGVDFCSFTDLSVEYTWKDETGTELLRYTVYNAPNGNKIIRQYFPGFPTFLGAVPVLTVAPTATTTYTLEREIEESLPSNSILNGALCGNDQVTIFVDGVDTPPVFTYELCDFELDAFGPSGCTDYFWDFGDGTTATGQNATHTYTTIGEYTIILSVECGNPCSEIYFLTIDVPENCSDLSCCPEGAISLHNAILSEQTGGGPLPENTSDQTICITGTLTVDENYEFTGELVMGPDAEIVVEGGVTLTLDNAEIHGCDFLWQGITLLETPFGQPVAALMSTNGTIIEDAFMAIKATPRTLLSVDHTTFNRNYIGIDIERTNLSGFYGNTFDCNANLKPFASGPAPGQLSYTGINTVGGTKIIGVLGQDANTFRSMRNGIVSRINDLTVVNTKFIDIHPGDGYPITGNGIFHDGVLKYTLKQRGFGDGASDPLSFYKCGTAIRAIGSAVRVSYNNMSKVNTGVRAEFCDNLNVFIHYNRIYSTQLGITLLQNDLGGVLDVIFNTITIDNSLPLSPLDETDAINVQENGLDHTVNIEGNVINLYGPNRGIFLQSVTGAMVQQNVITFQNSSEDKTGICLRDCLANIIDCNTVSGQSTLTGIGLDVSAAGGTGYHCNTFSKIQTGARFGEYCVGTEIATNTFDPPFVDGLVYLDEVQIDEQLHRGNIWLGSAGNYSGFGARHEGINISDIGFSRYLIHSNSTNHYPPSIELTNLPGVNPSNWFQIGFGTPEICNPNLTCPLTPAPVPAPSNEFVESLAQGANAVSSGDARIFGASRQLYKFIKAGLVSTADPDVSQFYTNSNSNAVGQIYEIEEAKSRLYRNTNPISGQVSTLIAEKYSLLEGLLDLDSLVAISTGTAQQNYQAQMSADFQDLSNHQGQLDTLLQIVVTARDLKADSIIVENSLWSTNTVYELNLKQLNAIYLSTFVKGVDTLDASQISTLAYIANQCPTDGGYAVYQARSLYALLVADDYDDTQLCNGGGALAKPDDLQETMLKLGNKEEEFNFALFPNPASQKVQLKYHLEHVDARAMLTDLWGRQVSDILLPIEQKQVTIETAPLPQGVYILKVMQEEKILFTERLIIQ